MTEFINRGKRDYNEYCIYYNVVGNYKDKSELIRNHKEDGHFWARSVNQKYHDYNTISGVMMLDNSSIQLETRDNVNLKPNDIVVYRNLVYKVSAVQPRWEYKNKMFIKDEYQTTLTTISLEGGDKLQWTKIL